MKYNKKLLTEMMSNIPTEKKGNIDNQLLRIGILSELDAINLYEQLAELATDETVKAMFLDIAKEESIHQGEFLAKLEESDEGTEEGLESGEEEEENLEEETPGSESEDEEEEDEEDMNEARARIYGRTATEQLSEMQKSFKKLIK